MKFEFTPVKDIIEDSSYFEDVKYGLYCWKLSEETNFNGFENSENDIVIYVGKAEEYIADRFYDNHLNPIRNFSTLRRSIGAVLKEELSLSALPKIDSKGNIIADKKKACRQYRFDEDGELKINQWMINNLEFGFIELDSIIDIKDKEDNCKEIIKPCLNCKNDKSYNIYYSEIKKLRGYCRKEAKVALKKMMNHAKKENII